MNRTLLRLATLVFAIVCGSTSLHAQSAIASLRPVPQSDRIAANADYGPQMQLTGHIPMWVSNGTPTAQSVDLNADMRLTIVLQRDPAVQAAFTQFLADQQTPGNPLYHQWLTPQQVGSLFGPTADDLNTVSNWLTAQGLSIINVDPSGVMINVHGTTAAVANAFRTSFAYFPLNGEVRRSAVNEPYIPTVLAPVVASIFGLTDVPIHPNSVHSGPVQLPSAGSASTLLPQYTSSGGSHYMTPGDFAIVYDVNSVYSAGNKGGGTVTNTFPNGKTKANSVAIIGQSQVAPTDISEFATLTGLSSSYTLNTITGIGTLVNPGPVCTVANYQTCSTGGDQGEQTLDVDRVVGTAPGATVDLIVSSSATGGGIYTAAQYNVSTQLDPVMTISYGNCEVLAGQASENAWDTVFSNGAAEGISTLVSSGDSGVNGCAAGNAANTTTYTASMNFICASTYATCVGGTEFNDTASPSSYWSSTNTTTGLITSALTYIPEGAWNEPGTAAPFQTSGSGGGPSIYIAKPSYQTALTPADTHRDSPDIAYPAALHDGYLACLDYATGNASKTCTTGSIFIFGGTSAAAPAMAGVTALLNAKLGTAQGALNTMLYTLAASNGTNSVFHSINNSTAGVGTCTITVPSMCNNSTPGSSALSTTATGGQSGYAIATSGYAYSEAIGLGSIDVANLLTAASAKVSTTLAVTTVSPNPVALSTTVTLTATITRSTTTAGNATGTVSFYYTPSGGTATLIGSAVTVASNAATTTTSFSTAGTYSITAIYSGDTNYATSTAAGVSLVVNPGPSFTVVPATTTYNLTSGATTGNTDVFTLTSTNAFVGSVTMACTAVNVSGTAAGSCAATTPVSLTSGGTGTSTATITTTPGTSGVLSFTLKGTSGSTVVTSSAITVNLTASSFTLTPLPTSISIAGNATTGNTSTVTVASVNGFAGLVTVGCASSNTAVATCTGGAATLTSGGTATVTLTALPILHTSGTGITLTASGSGTTTGAAIAATATTTVALTVTAVNSTTTLVALPTTVVAGSPTVLTATVTGASANGTPTGTVTFMAGTTTLGTGTLSGTGTATYTYTPAATAASATAASLTAVYGGDSGYNTSTSAAVALAVQGTTGAAASSSLSFTSGATTGNTDVITFTSVSGYAGAVTAACSVAVTTGTPAFPATCAASTAANVTAGGTTTSTITITSTTAMGKMSGPQQAGLSGWGIRGGAVLAMLLCLVPFRRRRYIRPLAVVLMLAGALTAVSGCSSGGSTPVKQSSAGTYTVTATGTSGTAKSTVTFTVTIN